MKDALLHPNGSRSTACSPSRRTFVRGLAIGSAALSLGFVPRIDGQAPSGESTDELSGNEFDLDIAGMPIDITGRPRTAIAINGRVPGPTLRWREGDTVTIRVRNSTDEVTSLHWHGILLPANMDGVPGLSFAGIAPGETYTYRFKVRQSGTYWYHSHSAFQEQIGLYAPLVIAPREPDPITSDREHVVMLSDWTDEDPERLFGKLKKQSNYYNQHQRTVGDFIRDVRRDGWSETIGIRAQWARMRMSDRDLADVTGATYTFLMNGQPPAANWTGLVQSGERVRLRLINGSSMTHFDVRIPGLKLTVVAADGLPVQPVEVDELRIAVAETYDVIVTPEAVEAYTIFAQALDRTGFAAGTLATRRGLRATVPDVDPRPSLSLTDMGHGHAGSSSAPAQDPHAGHNMGSAAGHTQTHPESERGNPLVDMQTMTAATSLADPGIGLRGNGRRVLTYADLRSPFPDPDGREPSRTIELHLTGHMERFAWSFDGIKFSASEPIELAYGERVRIVLVNDSMMTHPIHLHGMWSDLESEDGRFQVRKHTIDMPPGSRRSYRVTADALGRWAYHCHLLFHMEAGMLREVRVVERPGQ